MNEESLITTLTSYRTGLPLKTRGSILNVASVAGSLGLSRLSPYVISKHGVLGLTKTDAKDYAEDGIRVNAISPGWVKTDISKMIWDSPMVSRSGSSKAKNFNNNLWIEQHCCCQSANGSMGYAGRDSLHSQFPTERQIKLYHWSECERGWRVHCMLIAKARTAFKLSK
jgi:short-subunit dehydrogenase